jgi:hypothetical protein
MYWREGYFSENESFSEECEAIDEKSNYDLGMVILPNE